MTGRSHGRKNPTRVPGDDPRLTPEDREAGVSDRMQGYPSPVPGGKIHITNAPAMRRTPEPPDSPPEVKPINAHGVLPGSATTRERAELERGPNSTHDRVEPAKHKRHQDEAEHRPVPVPVYIVEYGSQDKVLRTASPRHVTCPASGTQPIVIAGKDPTRVRVGLLNESTSSDIRFGVGPSDATQNGALLPWPGNSYLWLNTQDEVWVVSADSGTPVISVISEHEQIW